MQHMTRPLSLFVSIFLVIGLGFAACGGSHRQDTLRVSLAATNAARTSFVTWDAAHQKEIITSASSKTEALSNLADYRDERDRKVMEIFNAVYEALAHAALGSDDQSMKDALAKATELVAAIKAFTSR